MIWKRYRNEMIVVISFLLMLMSSLYKNNAADQLDAINLETKTSLSQIGEIIALKKQWGNKNLTKKVRTVKKGIAPEKIKLFSVKGKKLNASFKGLKDSEMNSIILKLENVAVQIIKLNVKRNDGSYSMEIKCKW